jgi:N-acetylglucosaminyldiphosphoundecaprenol N-acetyl-beta-D-mannosaminyltransferase
MLIVANKQTVPEINVSTCDLLGARVNPLTMTQLNDIVAATIESDKKCVLANHNLHSLYLLRHEGGMRLFFESVDYSHVDGMALIFLGRCLGLPLMRCHRVTYADWFPILMRESARRNWRVFYLGSKPGVSGEGAAILRQQFAGLEIATAHGYFNASPGSHEGQIMVDTINRYKPHLLLVGMGMPRQEYWILNNLPNLSVNVILPSGAAMDYFVGAVPTPPRWVGKIGLEWLSRFINEPGRLWRRYLIEPWSLLPPFLAEVIRRRLLAK